MKFIPLLSLKKTPTDFIPIKLTTSRQAQEYARQFYFEDMEVYESFFLILMSYRNTTLAYVKISQGGITSTIVDPILVAKYAIDSLAKNIILVHNHPSGDCQPSVQDRDLTHKIKTGLKLFDINVADHIILTKNSYYSFANEGIL